MPSPKKPTTSPTKSITGRGSDGQHGNLPNCGCHDCVLHTLIVKGEPKEEGNMISKKLIDQIKKQNKVGQGIPKNRHPPNCLCVYHIDDWRKKQYRGGKASITPIQTPKLDNRGRSRSRDPRLNRKDQLNETKSRDRSMSASVDKSEKINKISVITPSR